MRTIKSCITFILTYVIPGGNSYYFSGGSNSTRHDGSSAFSPSISSAEGKSKDILALAHTSEESFDEN